MMPRSSSPRMMGWPTLTVGFLIVSGLTISTINNPKNYCVNAAFVHHRSLPRIQRPSTSPPLNWFSSSNNSNKKEDSKIAEELDKSVGVTVNNGMVGVGGVVNAMDNYKRVQRVGKLTSKLTQELGSTTVEGTAGDGMVKVTMDCQQRPLDVFIDESFVKSTNNSADLCSALTVAMCDAYTKSREKMEERMKSLYSELGLPYDS